MNTPQDADLGSYLYRGGRRIELATVPDRFTVRLRRGKSATQIDRNYNSTHRRRLRRQDLDEFAVDAAERDAVMERVRGGQEVEFASHVYAPSDDPQSKFYLTDQITVQFRAGVSDEEIERIAAGHGLSIASQVPGMSRTFVMRVGPQARENPIKIANRLAASDAVELSEPNVAVATRSQYVPTDTLFPEQWHLHNTGGPLLSTAAHIDAVRAWDVTRGVRSIVVAVADDSCDLSHVDFQGSGKVVAPRDFAGQDFEPLPELVDDNHGTACSGVAVAEESGIGTVGVAPGCALMPIRTSGFIDDTSIEDLCSWVVDRGAAVLSCSWSAAARYFPLSLRMRNALARAASLGRAGKGCVLVFASGNDNRPIDGTVNETGWPNNQPSGATAWLNGFATHADVIAVAASSSLAGKSAYSNWGRQISVCAPSNNARPRTYPSITGAVTGRGVFTTDRVGASGYSSTDYTNTFGGTSSACPTVAGVAALVLSANPALTAVAVREILQSTADRIVDNTADLQLGNRFGIYDANGHSQWFGFGRVNAFSAVAEAVRRLAAPGGGTLRFSSQPNVAIPDANAAGVRDAIAVTAAAPLSAIKIGVEVVHPYIGDLELTLISPAGIEVTLHRRSGGNADDIRRTYDLSTTPALAALTGQAAQGNWTLWARDLAPADVGRLARWELEIATSAGSVVEANEAPGVMIPDNNAAGIERTLQIAQDGQIRDIDVALDITHTYIGDLSVILIAPGGTQATLHQRSGGTQDNLVTTLRSTSLPALAALRGQSMRGAWKLRVADLEAIDVGKLNRWSLRIVG